WCGKDIHPGVAFFHGSVAFDPDQAAHQSDDQIRILSFERAERVEATKGAIFSTLPDNTGVEDDHPSLGGIRSFFETQSPQSSGKAVAVGDIHLTAFCPDMIFHRALLYLS